MVRYRELNETCQSKTKRKIIHIRGRAVLMTYPHWDNIYSAKNLKEMLKVIDDIDKDKEYLRLSFILKYDKCRGYDPEDLEGLK